MNPVLSPKELAQAIGVSESSLKRWADDGRIRVSRTAGGHRRIPIAEAIRFIREIRAPIVRPEILGMPDLTTAHAEETTGETDAERLYRHLLAGEVAQARGLVLSLYMAGHGCSTISDGVIGVALGRFGESWRDDPEGIFLEHRATEICISAVRHLQSTIAVPDAAPVAVGGAPPGDTGTLPSLVAATVLLAEGFRTVNLGAQTPFDALLHATDRHKADLVWLSATHVVQPELLERGVDKLSAELELRNVPLIIGGFAHGRLELPQRANVHIGHSMGELVAFAKGLRSGRSHAVPGTE